MTSPPPSSRRGFLAQLGCGAAALAGVTWGLDGRTQARADDASRAIAFDPDVEVVLNAAQSKARMLPGDETDVWTLQGRVVRGDPRMLEAIPSGALGPTFRVRTGQKLRVVLSNGLGQETILHWHGLHVPAVADGHPSLAIGSGRQYVYEFEVKGPAGTYWYHAHPDGRTGEQVYRGLAGLFIIDDPRESVSGLPSGGFDIALALQDRRFDARNQLVYLTWPMDRVTGFLGDRILVNGQADFHLRVARRPYRLRILNASNSRIYRLAWADGSPLAIVGTDGGLLERPVRRPYAMLAPAERLELWADFGRYPLGTEISLVSQAFDGTTSMSMGGVPQGAPLTIAKVTVDRPSADRAPLPETLRAIARHRWADAINADGPRKIVATMQHMGFAINGRTFEMNGVAPDEHVKLGTMEAWEFDNTAAARGRGMGMGMMGMASMPHPFHVHGGQFQVVRRDGVTHAGYVDEGWKDTVLVMPGEKATILMRFLDYPGTYLYHCHNLEHEDAGMMRNFRVDP
jgi:FtsP/CotA-like multicopper oxidase with cupredoxin domain